MRTWIARSGLRVPLWTISSKVSVKHIPIVDLLYSSNVAIYSICSINICTNKTKSQRCGIQFPGKQLRDQVCEFVRGVEIERGIGVTGIGGDAAEEFIGFALWSFFAFSLSLCERWFFARRRNLGLFIPSYRSCPVYIVARDWGGMKWPLYPSSQSLFLQKM